MIHKTAATFAPGIYKRKQHLRDFPKSAAIVLDFSLNSCIQNNLYTANIIYVNKHIHKLHPFSSDFNQLVGIYNISFYICPGNKP